jgi:hypothetical protein
MLSERNTFSFSEGGRGEVWGGRGGGSVLIRSPTLGERERASERERAREREIPALALIPKDRGTEGGGETLRGGGGGGEGAGRGGGGLRGRGNGIGGGGGGGEAQLGGRGGEDESSSSDEYLFRS